MESEHASMLCNITAATARPLVLWMALAAAAPAGLAAQAPPPEPADSDDAPDASGVAQGQPHYVVMISGGMPVRVTKNVDFDQRRVAPAFVDGFFGYALGGPDELQHGFGAGLSFNLSEDGGFTEPVGVATQWVVMPAYMAYLALTPDWLGLGHLGLPVLLGGGRSVGLELALGMGYRMLAGAGLVAEVSANLFPGASSTLHLSAAFELGIFLDYEVLP